MHKYLNPRPAKWPEADFVVGNPPFIGGKDLRQELGDGYAEALWESRPYMPGAADFVTYWWDTAANLAAENKIKRFGLISTNSITQTFSRRVIARHLEARKPVSIVFAIPDHPWLKAADRAAVRIAMTVADSGIKDGQLQEVVSEADLDTDSPRVTLSESKGKVLADLTIGANVAAVSELHANAQLSCPGFKLHGAGFIVTPVQATMLGLGRAKGLDRIIRLYRNGKDLTARPRGVLVIDLFGITADQVRDDFPKLYQWVVERVKPERDHNNRESYRRNWWIFGEPRTELRAALKGLSRYIATVETEKHRMFEFLDAEVAPDNRLVCIAIEDAWALGVLSSRVHVTWTLATGGTLEDRPIYTKTQCFDPFPFPAISEEQKARLRVLGERLDSFRKERLAAHPVLTMTKLYNALEKLRSGEPLDDKDKAIHEMGLVSILKQIHDDLDAAVAQAYGWPVNLSDQEILEKLVALNKERAAEEARGLVRWLRPEFQAPKEVRAAPKQIEAELVETEVKAAKPNFPRAPADQVTTIRAMLSAEGKPIRAGELARRFKQGKRVEDRVSELLQIMAAIGQAQTENGSRYFTLR
ncbi:MAG TPA: DNA methyltransferase [Micropepsaceae bacterium]|nr:DNA methyltransferase [Micropepsaceae bacterium]